MTQMPLNRVQSSHEQYKRIMAKEILGLGHHKIFKTNHILYSGLLLRGPNTCEICEHYLDSQKFLKVFVQYFLYKIQKLLQIFK